MAFTSDAELLYANASFIHVGTGDDTTQSFLLQTPQLQEVYPGTATAILLMDSNQQIYVPFEDYEVEGSSLILTSALSSGVELYAAVRDTEGSINTPSNNAVRPEHMDFTKEFTFIQPMGVGKATLDRHALRKDQFDQAYDQLANIGEDHTGIANPAESQLGFDDTTRKVWIEPVDASFTVHYRGRPTSLGYREIAIADTSGGRYIGLDPETWDLVELGPEPDFDGILTHYVYWNTTAQQFVVAGNERHTSSRDSSMHRYLHRVMGAQWRSGGSIDYTAADPTALTIGLSTPITLTDEDIDNVILHSATPSTDFEQVLQGSASLPLIYIDANGDYVQNAASNEPWVSGTSRLAYNSIDGSGLGSQVDVPSGSYVNYFVVLTNDTLMPVKVIQGRQTFASAQEAQAESLSDLGMAFPEFVISHQVVFYVDDALTANSYRAQIEEVFIPQEALKGGTQAFSPESHDSLSERENPNQHPASAIRTAPSGRMNDIEDVQAFYTYVADRLSVGGWIAGNPTGGRMGAGTGNFETLYQQGSQVASEDRTNTFTEHQAIAPASFDETIHGKLLQGYTFQSPGTNVKQVLKIAEVGSTNQFLRGRLSGSRSVDSGATVSYLIDVLYGDKGGAGSFGATIRNDGDVTTARLVTFDYGGISWYGIELSGTTIHIYPDHWFFNGEFAGALDLEALNVANVTNLQPYSDDNTVTNISGALKVNGKTIATLEDVVAAMPGGVIVQWSGTVDTIPAGWALCDGANGTPNLTDKFVIGAGSSYNVGAQGGSASSTTNSAGSHSHTGSVTISIGSTTLSENQMPSHEHMDGYRSYPYDSPAWGTGSNNGNFRAATSSSDMGGNPWSSTTGGGGSHTHSGSGSFDSMDSAGSHSHSVSTLPPYYALAFIMKL